MTNVVTVKLTTGNFLDIETRLDEVREIRDWILELVQDDTKFQMSYIASIDCIRIKFDEEKHAMLCALRWL